MEEAVLDSDYWIDFECILVIGINAFTLYLIWTLLSEHPTLWHELCQIGNRYLSVCLGILSQLWPFGEWVCGRSQERLQEAAAQRGKGRRHGASSTMPPLRRPRFLVSEHQKSQGRKQCKGFGNCSDDQISITLSLTSEERSLASSVESYSGLSEFSFSSSEYSSTESIIVSRRRKKKAQRKQRRSRSKRIMCKQGGCNEAQQALFEAMPIPFMEEEVIAKLESHCMVKRTQHLMGLPSTLLRSLRTFMPPAPDLASRRRRKETEVLLRVKAPSFLAKETMNKLERHLKKMILQKAWRLPGTVQEAVRHFESREEKAPWTISVQDRRERLSTRSETLDSKTAWACRGHLQAHMMKTSISMRQEYLPVQIDAGCRHLLLPRLIPPGQSYLQQRSSLCVSLRGKADIVEMNIKCKRLHFLWGLPTIQMQSLAKMVPRPPLLPATWPSRAPTHREFRRIEPSFIAPKERQDLEDHVLRKRLQHLWGQPGLVQRSLKRLLLPVPASWPRSAPMTTAQWEMQIGISIIDIPFIQREVKGRLEVHLRRKIIERYWGRPRRVLEALKMFSPISPPPMKGFREDGGSFVLTRQSSMKMSSLTMQRFSQKPAAPSMKPWERKILEVHLAKKAVEIQLGRIPLAAQQPCKEAPRALPKRIPPRRRSLQPRSRELLFVDRAALDRIQLNIVHKEVAYRWGLPTIYHKSLAQLLQGAAFPVTFGTLFPRRQGRPSFTARETPFINAESRNLLEQHVRSKALQHTWGLPRLIQRSLRRLLPDTARICPQKTKYRERVAVRLTELSFISKDTQALLEKNVAQRVIHKQWGLPTRVLNSLRLLFPETRRSTFLEGRRIGDAALHQTRCCHRLKDAVLATLRCHLTKKSLEIHLGSFPLIITISWQCTLMTLRRSLPKLIRPGVRPLEPRIPSHLFGLQEMGRIELNVRCRRLESLWGLGTKYVKAIAGMEAPRMPFAPLRTRGAILEFEGTEIRFLQRTSKEIIEQHVKKKRVQHEWGLPTLVQRSLRGLMQETPSMPHGPKTLTQTFVTSKELLFLPKRVCHHLEIHIQKMKLQHHWGLPQRILEATKTFLPLSPPRRAPIPQKIKRKESVKAVSRIREEKVDHGRWTLDNKKPLQSQSSLHDRLRRSPLETHLKKKALNVEFQSRRFAESPRQGLLPKPALVSSERRPRRSSLYSMEQEALRKIQLNIKQKHLTSLWGLPTVYRESMTEMFGGDPERPWPHRTIAIRASSKVSIYQKKGTAYSTISEVTGRESSKRGPAFIPRKAQDLLEMHVQRKKLQHQWGLPVTVQKSLRALVPAPPEAERSFLRPSHAASFPRDEVTWRTSVFKSMPFDPEMTRTLESHVKSRSTSHKWHLPSRVQDSLKAFLPPASFPQDKRAIARSQLPWPLAQSRIGATAKPKETVRQRTPCATAQPSLGRVTFTCSEEKPSFLTEEAWNLLEFHVVHKRIQHAWALPSCVVRSLRHFAPFPHLPEREAKKSTSKTKPWERTEVKAILQNYVSLSPKRKDFLEAHVTSMVAKHRWEIPRQMQKSTKGFMPPRPPSRSKQDPSLPFTWDKSKTFQVATDDSQTEGEKEYTPRKAKSRRSKRKQDASSQRTRPLSDKGSASLRPEANLPFLSAKARDFLEFHILHKRIQHTWGLPSKVMQSLHMFSPIPLKKEKFAGHRVAMARSQEREEVKIVPSSLSFLSSKAQERLSAHLRHTIAEHRWGLPERAQKSVKAFQSLRDPPRSRIDSPHPLFYCQYKSVKRATDDFQYKDTEALQEKFHHKRHPATAASGHVEGRTSSNIRVNTQFFSIEVWNLLEFHILHKRIQHTWGIPSKVMQSLHIFSPFPQKEKKYAEQSVDKTRIQERGEVRVMVPSLSFLCSDTERRLDVHLSHKVAEHKWGLPKRAQQSLRAFAPRPPQPQGSDKARRAPQATSGNLVTSGEVGGTVQLSESAEDLLIPPCLLHFLNAEMRNSLKEHVSKWVMEYKWLLPKQIQAVLEVVHSPSHQKSCTEGRQHHSKRKGESRPLVQSRKGTTVKQKETTRQRARGRAAQPGSGGVAFHCPEKKPSFLTEEAWNSLEFHVAHKRIQHTWGLPSKVTQSLNVFSPFRLKKKEHTGQNVGKARSQERGDVKIVTPNLHFLCAETQTRLNSQLSRKIAEHKWGLTERAQKSLKAFQPPRTETSQEDDEGTTCASADTGYEQGSAMSDASFPIDAEKKWSSSPEEQSIYQMETFGEIGQDRRELVWLGAEEPCFSSDTESTQVRASQGTRVSWKTENEISEPSELQEKSVLDFHLKRTSQGQSQLSSGTYSSSESRSSSLDVKYKTLTRAGSTASISYLSKRSEKSNTRIEEMVDDRHHPVGLWQPLGPSTSKDIKDIGETEQSDQAPECSCSCQSSASRKDSVLSLPSSVEQTWQWEQQEDIQGKVEWTTASSSLPSKPPSQQSSLSSLEEGRRALWLSGQGRASKTPSSSLQVECTTMTFAERKESISWFSKRSERSNKKPFEAQQDMASNHEYTDLVLLPPPHVESQSSYEDCVGRNYQRGRSEKREQPSTRQRQRRGSRLRWSRVRGKASPCQILGDFATTLETGPPASPPAREQAEGSCESASKEICSSKSPQGPEGNKVSIQEQPLQGGIQASEGDELVKNKTENPEARTPSKRGAGIIGGKKEEEMPLSPREEHHCGLPLFCGEQSKQDLLGGKQTEKSTSEGHGSIAAIGPIDDQVAVIAAALEKKLNLGEKLMIWQKYCEFKRLEGKEAKKPEYRPQLTHSWGAKDQKASITAAKPEKKKPNCPERMRNWWKSLTISSLKTKRSGT
ncbi:protein SPATA31F1 isoform X1 [Anolis carolinensis]|uniref:protein SPATA31F1 isoform X1 n=2 Tax=Anolis carolinensis TaxID=28377 RepID=UPI002F2B6C7F